MLRDSVLIRLKLEQALYKIVESRNPDDEDTPLEKLTSESFDELVEKLAKGIYPDEDAFKQAEEILMVVENRSDIMEEDSVDNGSGSVGNSSTIEGVD